MYSDWMLDDAGKFLAWNGRVDCVQVLLQANSILLHAYHVPL